MRRTIRLLACMAVGCLLPVTAGTQTEPSAPATPALPSVAEFFTDPSATISGANNAYKSLFFDAMEMQQIRAALDAYETRKNLYGGNGSDLMKALQLPQQAAEQIIEHPQFFLAAIAYHAPEEWTVWLNDMRFTQSEQPKDDIRVVDLNKQRAIFEWTPRDSKLYVKRKTMDTQAVSVDASGKIVFTLYPNQTFSSYTMEVREGWMPPVFYEHIRPAEGVAAPVDAASGSIKRPGPAPTVADRARTPEEVEKEAKALGLPTAPLPSTPVVGIKEGAKP